MIKFIYHDGLQKEIVVLEKRFRYIKKGLESFERLCEVQFNPTDPKQIIAPAKLHRITQDTFWSMWKVELVIPKSNLRPNQYPRLWFAVKGSVIVFLCISSHIENYKDVKMNELSLMRVTDVF